MIKYTRLSLEEREKIFSLLYKDFSISKIAQELNRHKSTISREVKRCYEDALGYLPDRAHAQYKEKLSRNKALFLDNELQKIVIAHLTEDRWSPEQISGRLKYLKSSKRASTETIYKFIYSDIGLELKLPTYLKQRRKKRGFRKSRKHPKSRIPDLVPIKKRPKFIHSRKSFGHWEGDLVIYSTTGMSNITSIVERKTRFTKIVANQSKRTDEVIGGINQAFAHHRKALKSITFDRGSEFTRHRDLKTNSFFCDPASPWQKGSVENTNSRIRTLMPKIKTPKIIKQKYVDQVADILNNTPRKVLGFKTPHEAFQTNLKMTPT